MLELAWAGDDGDGYAGRGVALRQNGVTVKAHTVCVGARLASFSAIHAKGTVAVLD